MKPNAFLSLFFFLTAKWGLVELIFPFISAHPLGLALNSCHTWTYQESTYGTNQPALLIVLTILECLNSRAWGLWVSLLSMASHFAPARPSCQWIGWSSQGVMVGLWLQTCKEGKEYGHRRGGELVTKKKPFLVPMQGTFSSCSNVFLREINTKGKRHTLGEEGFGYVCPHILYQGMSWLITHVFCCMWRLCFHRPENSRELSDTLWFCQDLGICFILTLMNLTFMVWDIIVGIPKLSHICNFYDFINFVVYSIK